MKGLVTQRHSSTDYVKRWTCATISCQPGNFYWIRNSEDWSREGFHKVNNCPRDQS